MSHAFKPSWIESTAENLGIIPKLPDKHPEHDLKPVESGSPDLTNFPAYEDWDDWAEYEAKDWATGKTKRYSLVPTVCFNCEAGCGLLAYMDKETGKVRKFEGNPHHPGSRGRNCAKGPATINQINDTDRILHPLKRKGKRGEGGWERIGWDQVLDEIAAEIRKAIQEERKDEVVYHVGRPGHEGYIERVLNAWGVDGHNSHTNICSAGARLGYAIWHGADRPAPDYANAKFILLISSHLEAGHYFNPHAQRIMEAKNEGAKIAVMDIRLSNTASRADYWMPTRPGTEAAVLLAVAKVMLDEGIYNETFLKEWTNWQDWLKADHSDAEPIFENFIEKLREHYADYTPEFAEAESGVPAKTVIEVARRIGAAGTQFAAHVWRSAASGNLGGWQVARCLHFLNVLSGSVGTFGGTLPNSWGKFHPSVPNPAPPHKTWNELHFPDEYPLSHYEMSFLLPHFLKEGRGKLAVYFTRVFNPVWTYPDGFSWIEALRDPKLIGLHAALTPTWNETAFFADYVLPVGHASERHDLVSYETHSGLWIGFRQPVHREFLRRQGKPVTFTYEANPGEVWEEDEFWIELSWRVDPDGSLGIRKYFESPYRADEKMTIDEYYQYIFERVPGLPEVAEKEGISALEYMQRHGAYAVENDNYKRYLAKVNGKIAASGLVEKGGEVVGVKAESGKRVGFPTPSRKQELYSQTLVDWKWPEYALPAYIKSHVHESEMDRNAGEFPLVPTYRLPTLIHSRSTNAKWLMEIANRNPLWMHTSDAKRLGYTTGDLVRVNTEIGHFVARVWATEAVRPGTLACSHHLGRWRRSQDPIANRWGTSLVDLKEEAPGQWRMRKKEGVQIKKSSDPDSSRIFWEDTGVHQNITFPVHPDPQSGMHCWHQKVRLEKAQPDDEYGDVFVDTNKSMAIYRKWLEKTRPAPGPDNLRRPLWLKRPLRPETSLFYLDPKNESNK